jgi:hypothetical protein
MKKRGIVYRGWRDRGGCHISVRDPSGIDRPLEHVFYHNEDGFLWGPGTRPRLEDLSLSILVDALDGEEGRETLSPLRESFQLHEAFAWHLWQLIARADRWELPQQRILDWVEGAHAALDARQAATSVTARPPRGGLLQHLAGVN